MRINHIDQAHPVSVVAHDAAEALKGVIESFEDHLINDIELTREKISSNTCALRYIMSMLCNISDRVETLGRAGDAIERRAI